MNDTKHVLVVDDEEDIVWAISRSFINSKPNVVFDCALNAKDALVLIRESGRFDLLITDLRMPGMDGIDLSHEARRLNEKLAVVIMTAYGAPEVMDRGESLGEFHYLPKPFDIGYLRKTILRALKLEKSKFSGALGETDLRELFEINCISKSSFSVHVKGKQGNGAIYVNNGDVIHAECGKLLGENAFYSILDWTKGTFSVRHEPTETRRTISRDWWTLLHYAV